MLGMLGLRERRGAMTDRLSDQDRAQTCADATLLLADAKIEIARLTGENRRLRETLRDMALSCGRSLAITCDGCFHSYYRDDVLVCAMEDQIAFRARKTMGVSDDGR